jgi:hypothetical protein
MAIRNIDFGRGAWLAAAGIAVLGMTTVFGLSACKGKSQTTRGRTGPSQGAVDEAAGAKEATPAYGAVPRLRFNQLAVRSNIPLFWVSDADGDSAVDPDEVAALMFYPTTGHWVEDGKFTKEFEQAYASIAAQASAPPVPDGITPEEAKRRAAVVEEMDQGRPTLVMSDLRDITAEQRVMLRLLLEAGAMIDGLYARTSGIDVLANQVPADDVASQSMFRRNWGPECVFPKTEKNPACTAIPGAPRPKVDVYPAWMQDDKDAFCATLEKDKNAKKLLAPFVVVRGEADALGAVPYTEAYRDEMEAVALKLDEAARTVFDPAETALVTYMKAAAQAFRDNDWAKADEAWAAMSATNSEWYLRIGPDETYWEPCSQKAGFHMTLARIDTASLEWQQKLTPIRQEMEERMAKRCGAPYESSSSTAATTAAPWAPPSARAFRTGARSRTRAVDGRSR